MFGSERRRIARHPGTGLVAHFDGVVTEVLDISLGGIRLARACDPGQGEIRFRVGRRNRPGTAAEATAVKVAVGEHDLRLKFVGMNYRLAQLIIEHIAAVSGATPYIFR